MAENRYDLKNLFSLIRGYPEDDIFEAIKATNSQDLIN
jgi:hypothetical protein